MKLECQVVVRADVPNLNNRIYPRKVLERAVEDFKKLEKGSMIGQMGMPMDSVVSLSMASHVVEDLRIDQDNLVADIRVLDTECGRRLSDMVEKGGVAFRLQGEGWTEPADGAEVIQDNYRIIAVNAVSAEDAS